MSQGQREGKDPARPGGGRTGKGLGRRLRVAIWGPRPRRRRKEVPGREKVVGAALLAIPVAFAAYVVAKSRVYDPALFRFEPKRYETLPEAERIDPGEAKAAVLKGTGPGPQDPLGFLPDRTPASGWTRSHEVERFTPGNLYEKIDGRAEAYINYHVSSLHVATYSDPKAGDREIEVLLFDMTNPVYAEGKYLEERPPDFTPLEGDTHTDTDTETDGYTDGTNAFFRRGRYFVQVMGESPESGEVAREIALAIAGSIPEEEIGETVADLFPEEGRLSRPRFVAKDAFGLDFLDEVFTAPYGSKESPVDLFGKRCPGPAEAEETRRSYAGFLKEYGKPMPSIEVGGIRCEIGRNDTGAIDAFFVRGDVILGLTGARDIDSAKGYLSALVERSAPSGAGAAPAPEKAMAAFVPDRAPAADWPHGPFEFYNARDMYKKINGRVEAYLAYGVLGLVFAAFAPEDRERVLDVFVYDMGSGLNALGMYSSEKAPDAPAAAIGAGAKGYQIGPSVFFRKGRYYTQVIGSEPDDAMNRAVLDMAAAIAGRQPRAEEIPLPFLPETEKIPDSEGYVTRDAFGLGFLRDVFTALYGKDDEPVTLFAARAKDAKEAEGTAAAFLAHIQKQGKLHPEVKIKDTVARLAEMKFGGVDGFFLRGTTLGGVIFAPDLDTAKRYLERLVDSVSASPVPTKEELTG